MIKQLAGCIREYKRAVILAPLFSITEVIMEVVIPFLMAQIVDYGINAGNMSYIMKIGLVLIFTALLSLLSGFLGGRYAAAASAGFAKNIRRDIYYNVQKLSFANIDKYSTSGLVTRLTTDVTNLQNAFQMIIRIAVRAPAMLVFSIIMAMGINWKLSITFLAIMPFLAVALYLIATKAHPIFERVFQTYDKLNMVVQENLRGIRVVKSYVREAHEIRKFGAVSDKIYKDFSRAERLVTVNMPIMQLAMNSAFILIAWFGANMIVSDTMTTGQLMSLFSYAAQCLVSLMMLSHVLVMTTISRASAERIVEILNEKSSLRNCDSPRQEVINGNIRFDHVDFSYSGNPKKLVLKDISLDIKSGEMVGIIGGTGSAKTSLVQLIPRLYDITGGELTIGGVPVGEIDLHTLRNKVAMVLQKNVLFSGTIRENLRWGKADATEEEMRRACKLAQADEFIQDFPDGYDTYIEQGGTNVSGGQRQRLCIARALLKTPKILILDDSTSAVDTKTDALIRRTFKEDLPDVTKLIIAQRISSIEDADKIIVMDGGRVSDVGTHAKLLETSVIYREVYTSQMKGGAAHAEA